MPKLTTLTEFVEEQLTRFDIPNTEKNHNKLRIKFTRTLKELGIWDTAETKLIGRKHTKVFTYKQLQQLYSKVEPYLLKHSNINTEELESYRRSVGDYLEELNNMTNDKYEEQLLEAQYEPPKVTRSEAMEVMLTALFEKFFEPLDTRQWNKDKETDFFTDPMDYDTLDYFSAQKRLNNPVDSYVKPKEQ